MINSQGLTFVDPAIVVNQLGIEAGDKVADFGCGAGYFSFECARLVGNDGMVFALDVLPSALEAVASHAKAAGMSNVVTKRVNLENEQGSGLGTESLDWVILKDMLFQNKKKDSIIREAARVLKPGGRALIMEWSKNDSFVGPEKDLRLAEDQLQSLVAQVRFTVERELSAGGFHYAFIVKK